MGERCKSCQVSVVIPVFNSAGTLQRAIHSILRQSLQDCELLIVDDASQDGSLALAQRSAVTDRRISVIALPTNRGKSHAMNVAIARARGCWIAVLDADDWYEPDRLAVLVGAGEGSGAPLVADNQYFIDAAANSVVRTAFPSEQGDRRLTKQVFADGSDPYAEFNYGMLKPVVRATFLRETKLTYRENARLSEDFLYLVEFLATGGTGYLVSRPLYNWTQAFGCLSRQWTTTGAGSWRYDFQSALLANAEVRDLLRQRQEHILAGLLDARARAFRRLHHINEINRLRAEGARASKVFGTIANHPSIWPQVAMRLLRSVRRRRAIARSDFCIAASPTNRVDTNAT
jgi:glycosyltransferase involved in cell wall biosynthesis